MVHVAPAPVLGQGRVLVEGGDVAQGLAQAGQDNVEVVEDLGHAADLDLGLVGDVAEVAAGDAELVDDAVQVRVQRVRQRVPQALEVARDHVRALRLVAAPLQDVMAPRRHPRPRRKRRPSCSYRYVPRMDPIVHHSRSWSHGGLKKLWVGERGEEGGLFTRFEPRDFPSSAQGRRQKKRGGGGPTVTNELLVLVAIIVNCSSDERDFNGGFVRTYELRIVGAQSLR